MANSFTEDLKQQFSTGSPIVRLLMANVGVFLLINVLIYVSFFLVFGKSGFEFHYKNLTNLFATPWELQELLIKPWTLLSYMFLHADLSHLFFNMLMLYFLGTIIQSIMGQSRMYTLYFMGGIAGTVLYILLFNLLPNHFERESVSGLVGASAAVSSIMVAGAAFAPRYQVHLFGVFSVPLVYIAGLVVVTSLLGITSGNAGGQLAHLGGALYGFLYVQQLKRGKDWSVGFNRVTDKIQGVWYKLTSRTQRKRKKPGKKPFHKVYRNTTNAKGENVSDEKDLLSQQERVDMILEKIKRSGWESLSSAEKDFLSKAGKKL